MTALTEAEQDAARRNWALMPDDMRELVKAFVDTGLMDGRKSLAACRVRVLDAEEGQPHDVD